MHFVPVSATERRLEQWTRQKGVKRKLDSIDDDATAAPHHSVKELAGRVMIQSMIEYLIPFPLVIIEY